MANDNAAHAFKEKQRDKEDLEARLAEVQRVLRLPRPPRRIECLDISHLGGSDTVAAIAALTDGAPDRRRYKSFHVHTVAGGDDYGAMKEVLSRRLAHAGEVGWELPDLLVVDGGKGQLGVAMAVLRDLGISDVPVCALAKEKDIGGQSRRERIYLPGRKNPLVLADRSATRSMIGMVRDEAHRLSNDLRKKLGRRRRLRSDLEDVPGIGRRTRTKLLTALGSLEAVIAADEATLVAAGATARQARAIRAAFHSDEASGVSATRTDVDRTMALGPRELPGAESSSANEAEVDPATESKAAFSGTVAIAWGRESADESSAPSGAAETDADAEEIALSNAFESLEGPSRSPVTPWSAHSGSPVQRRAIDEA
jgi:excinuclease ABC subunit C